jgi:hypothetical protein
VVSQSPPTYTKDAVRMRFIIAFTKFQVALTIICRELICCMDASYAAVYERESSVLVYGAPSVSTDNMLMWICEMQYTI